MAQAGRLNSRGKGLTSGIRTAAFIVVSNSALAAAGLLLLAVGRPGWPGAILTAFIINLTLGLSTVGLLSATVERGNKVFVSAAGGGPLLRLGLLGLSIYLWSRAWPATLPVFAIASVVFCSACLIAEIAYAAQGLADREVPRLDRDAVPPDRFGGERGPAELAL